METSNCSMKLIHLWADVYQLAMTNEGKVNDFQIWDQCLEKCLASKDEKVKTIWVRMKDDDFAEIIGRVLHKHNFNRGIDRTEFKKTLSLLPSDDGTPLTWKLFSELPWSKEELFLFLLENGKDDPDFDCDPNFMDDWFSDPVLTCGPDSISIGFLDDKPVAFAVSQINPKTGWSRISYMGMIPAVRGQGLGKWIHRRGFSELKKLGGKLYHGGTATKNLAMMALFKKHECDFFVQYQQWSIKL